MHLPQEPQEHLVNYKNYYYVAVAYASTIILHHFDAAVTDINARQDNILESQNGWSRATY
jgi:hypothetical protein